MSFQVRPAANADVQDALVWLIRRERYAAAAGVWVEWVAGQTAIEATPRLYPPADDAPAGREVRNYLTRRYGYRIVYEVTPADTVVLAFLHVRRRPAAWLRRLTP
jgi:plasmid stabilization system protein ParE